jgi:hypothetical protein
MRIRSFATLAFATLLACDDDPIAFSAMRGLTLSVVLSSAELPRGAPDTVTMTVTNTSTRPITLTAGACQPQGFVVDAGGSTVAPVGVGCILVLNRFHLTAGERLTRQFVWQTGAFPPGDYTVHATFTAEEVRLVSPKVGVRLRDNDS